MHFSTVIDNTQIVEPRISQDKVCRNNKLVNKVAGYNQYTLLTSKLTTCSGHDTRFSKLNTLSDKEYHTSNSMTSTLSMLPGYTTYTNINWSQFIRGYIPWHFTKDCRELVKILFENKDIFDRTKIFQLLIMV